MLSGIRIRLFFYSVGFNVLVPQTILEIKSKMNLNQLSD